MAWTYDKLTDSYFQNDFHRQNSIGAAESVKKQKPFSREEAIAQLRRNQQTKEELCLRKASGKDS